MLRWRSWKEIPVTIKSITLLKKGLWKVFNVILLLLLLFYKVQSTLALRTPRYYGHSDNTDSTAHTCIGNIANNKGRTIRKLIGGGGVGGEEPKKYSRQGKLNEKKYIHARQLTLKIFMLWPKKNSYKEFDNEKTIPPP